MKIRLLIVCLLSCFAVMAAKTVQLTVNWTFLEVIEGYDHDNKMIITVDGNEVGESKVFKETAKASYTVSIPAGKHEIKVMNRTFYEGKWEDHIKANTYSVDAFYEGILDCSSNTTINMTFNIDTETSDISVTGAKAAKGTTIPLAISWKYTNVIEGYDYESRMIVYIDGKQVATSAIFLQSKQGKMVVDVPKGNHEILIENYAFYEGKWELHSRENEYSIDAIYTANMSFEKKKRSIGLVFDIKTETTKTKVK